MITYIISVLAIKFIEPIKIKVHPKEIASAVSNIDFMLSTLPMFEYIKYATVVDANIEPINTMVRNMKDDDLLHTSIIMGSLIILISLMQGK